MASANDPYGWQSSIAPAYDPNVAAPAPAAAPPPVATPGGGGTGAPIQGGTFNPMNDPLIKAQVAAANRAWFLQQNGQAAMQGYDNYVAHPNNAWQQRQQQMQAYQQQGQQPPAMTPGGGGTGAPLQGGQQFQAFDAGRQSRWRDMARQWHSTNWQAQTPSTAVTPPDGTVHANGSSFTANGGTPDMSITQKAY